MPKKSRYITIKTPSGRHRRYKATTTREAIVKWCRRKYTGK